MFYEQLDTDENRQEQTAKQLPNQPGVKLAKNEESLLPVHSENEKINLGEPEAMETDTELVGQIDG